MSRLAQRLLSANVSRLGRVRKFQAFLQFLQIDDVITKIENLSFAKLLAKNQEETLKKPTTICFEDMKMPAILAQAYNVSCHDDVDHVVNSIKLLPCRRK